MTTYRVFGLISATAYLGDVEAESIEEAREAAYELASPHSLCHECSRKLDIGDIYEVQVEEATEG